MTKLWLMYKLEAIYAILGLCPQRRECDLLFFSLLLLIERTMDVMAGPGADMSDHEVALGMKAMLSIVTS